MDIVFRVDASLDIGSGHVMRCLALAAGLRRAGARCVFVSRRLPGNLLRQIEGRGFETCALPVPPVGGTNPDSSEPEHAAWLGVGSADDADQTLAAIAGTRFDWLVVDHYALDARWEGRLRAAARRIFAIDDLADRRHDCDLLLDQNPGRVVRDYVTLVPAGARVLADTNLALLRPEFANLREEARRRPRKAPRNLLITLGGVDKMNATSAVLRGLSLSALPPDLRVNVIMGATAPWLSEVREAAAGLPCHAQVRVDVSDMGRLMLDSDLAIGAAGTTALERCCLGLPSLVIVLAKNQRGGADALARSGAVLLLREDGAIESEVERLLPLVMDEARIARMSASAMTVTAGDGVSLMVKELTDAG